MTMHFFLLQLFWWCLATLPNRASSADSQLIKVRYGYFPEARPIHAACARGFFDLHVPSSGVKYVVACHPQTSGGFAASRLDNGQLHIANLGSTPMAQAVARGIDLQAIYISHYMGESQGIYVRPDAPESRSPYESIQTPFDLEGRTVGVPFGSTMHYQVLFLIDLFGLAGLVKLVDLSPAQIIQAWDDGEIDAGACWGQARDHLLTQGNARTLLTASDLANWGRPTFVVVAAQRQFATQHSEFITHFVAILSRLNDSFLDRLGEQNERNAQRWRGEQYTGTEISSSFVPSLVDALMLPEETPHNPSLTAIHKQRRVLELFHQIPANVQLSCTYLGPMAGACTHPTLAQETLQDTAGFLLDQKVIATLGRLERMAGDNNSCQQDASTFSFCSSDVLDGSFLAAAQRDCTNCFPVGIYEGSMASTTNLLDELERLDAESRKLPYAENEVGRAIRGESGCQAITKIAGPTDRVQGSIGDGANFLPFRSYSDNMDCWWEIRSLDCTAPKDACNGIVEIDVTALRLWSGDMLQIFSDPMGKNCKTNAESNVLVAQLSGFQDASSLPNFRAKGCILVRFNTDFNSEKSYGDSSGDGFTASFNRNASPCSDASHCNGLPCVEGMCECGGRAFGADCAHTDYCIGTNRLSLNPGDKSVVQSSSSATVEAIRNAVKLKSMVIKPRDAYRNDLDCSWQVQVPRGLRGHVIKATIYHDLEPTHDLLHLQTGALSLGGQRPTSYAVVTGTHEDTTGDAMTARVYYIPADRSGFASLRFQTDALGRRVGFHAVLETVTEASLAQLPCLTPGYSGRNCESPHCVANNELQTASPSSEGIAASHVLGRVKSQAYGVPVRAMPWAIEGGCVWRIPSKAVAIAEKIVAIRFVFNSPLDLEARPVSAFGDQLMLRTSKGTEAHFFIEQCKTDDDCLLPWQTGVCEAGRCTVGEAVEATIDGNLGGASIRLVTDRNDGGQAYHGLDFDALLVQTCPNEAGRKHCEAHNSNGKCSSHGFCICPDGIPCDCPCEGKPPTSAAAKVGLTVGVVLPLFLILIGGFLVYRHRKILASREQKRIIAEKEAQLEAFRDSIVGMRVAVREYVPKVVRNNGHNQNGGKQEDFRALSKTNSLRVSITKEPPKVVWCWQETSHCMDNHDASTVFGDPKDCWICYDSKSTAMLEHAYQKGRVGQCQPLKGYTVDLKLMTQTKDSTGYQRKVQRVVLGSGVQQTRDLDLSDAHFSDGLPNELAGEPQVVLIKDDIIQISKTRDDGWSFGTKLYHADEPVARELVKLACKDANISVDDANILADTGWFQDAATTVPTGDQLTALQAKVGDTNALDAPSHWAAVTDPTLVERYPLVAGNAERDAVVSAFLQTFLPPKFRGNVRVSSVERIQNLAMWQSFVVKRQTICWRETEMLDDRKSADVQKRAQDRVERRWLWHGSNGEVVEKILQQGFNRSFCGKNATMHGKGVYFARDAVYSADPLYSVPDKHGHQYMLACRVVVGEYCRGVKDALTPDVRDASNNILYDSTVGVLRNDTMANPSIYVTYHDSQAYPEYLIKFRVH